MRFLRPDLSRLILLAMFLALAFLGWREADAFSDQGNAPGTAVWPIWMALLAPLGLVLHGLKTIGLETDVFRAVPVVFWIVQFVYFYLLACVIAAVAGALRRRATAGRR